MNDFADWIGREEERADTVCASRMAGLMALLDKSGPLPATLPLLGHWLLAPPIARQSELDVDGHPRRGGNALLPPIPLPRRMWAGSEVDFDGPIAIGAAVIRHTRIVAIEPKAGRSGSVVFVTLEHDICCNGVSAIRERQHIVYREAPAATVIQRPLALCSGKLGPLSDAAATYTADPIALFRYSALTFNGHRIHYDRDHAAAEGYPDLVVHGPLLATLLLDHALQKRPCAVVRRFSFRAQAPIFAGRPFVLASEDNRLWITDAEGRTAMTAVIAWA